MGIHRSRRNRITFESQGLEPRLHRFAVEGGQSLASIVRQVLEVGLQILETKSEEMIAKPNNIEIFGQIAHIEITKTNQKDIKSQILLEFTPSPTKQARQHLIVVVTERSAIINTQYLDIGDTVLVKGVLIDTSNQPPIVDAKTIIPITAINIKHQQIRSSQSTFSLFK
ncbi:hypothetical protein V6O07_00530 [Arthrospira platensis SPKY2]